MALFGQQRRAEDGQYTQKIYGCIRDQKFSSAIEMLQQELQVTQHKLSSTAQRGLAVCLASSFATTHTRIDLKAGQPYLSWGTATTKQASSSKQRICE
jgi:hypothetical protein